MTKNDSMFRVDRVAAPLRVSVTESIRNAIAIGRFKPGDHLPERELCEMTGVSRTLVREAMRQLESEGLVTVEPHRGPFVTKISRQQAEGIYEVRQELESLACRLFVANASDEQRKTLKAALSSLRAACRKQDPQGRLAAKNHFYDCLVEGANNEALGNCIYMMNSRITLLRATSLKAPGRIKESIKELDILVDALLARDADKAAELARIHIGNAAAAAIPLIEEEAD
ncbi:transcriptional regulator, GntR family [Roseovarius pacificus]|uniref:Transcriptional regulator, GntR family n=1 Tax=Roseovarius pacificus TaxID=337701 RepID=A0A1M7AHP0_9RHOB|nr:GntR family transcriptional regulator [Roseovarius pacificus]GGO53450.1 GntR family transcriptional regulator [Roseovarius pacificus]SHL42135.1 transcriptional regulator, GntR family [Roseovarius pacificus]